MLTFMRNKRYELLHKHSFKKRQWQKGLNRCAVEMNSSTHAIRFTKISPFTFFTQCKATICIRKPLNALLILKSIRDLSEGARQTCHFKLQTAKKDSNLPGLVSWKIHFRHVLPNCRQMFSKSSQQLVYSIYFPYRHIQCNYPWRKYDHFVVNLQSAFATNNI